MSPNRVTCLVLFLLVIMPSSKLSTHMMPSSGPSTLLPGTLPPNDHPYQFVPSYSFITHSYLAIDRFNSLSIWFTDPSNHYVIFEPLVIPVNIINQSFTVWSIFSSLYCNIINSIVAWLINESLWVQRKNIWNIYSNV